MKFKAKRTYTRKKKHRAAVERECIKGAKKKQKKEINLTNTSKNKRELNCKRRREKRDVNLSIKEEKKKENSMIKKNR